MCLALDTFSGGFGGFPRLVLKSVPRPTYQYAFNPAPPESVAPAEPAPDHWIELEIVDDDGVPAPEVPFYLVWSSGRVQHGRADASGIGRVEDLGTGDFEVRMAIDDVAWRPG